MRIDDICLVVSDVDRSDDFYSNTLGLKRRMRNVRFADFSLGDGARLALWVDSSIAETVGPSYPTGAAMPFTVTLDLEGVLPGVEIDPDGFTIIRNPAPAGDQGLSAVTLAVADLERSTGFLTILGFTVLHTLSDSVVFTAGPVELTVTLDARAGLGAEAPPSTGRVMLAIELETGPEVDALYTELRAHGLVDSGPPRLYEWGARSAYFIDHDGYIWEIYAWVETPR